MRRADGITAEWATRQAESHEAAARCLRDPAERLSNPGLLPDERTAAAACGDCEECMDGLDCSRWRP